MSAVKREHRKHLSKSNISPGAHTFGDVPAINNNYNWAVWALPLYHSGQNQLPNQHRCQIQIVKAR